ncbi:MAG: hypothetical protein JKY37_19670, partial [Nannocystaceae bacterium]|nr:hypothetical protein [Nannocystaceae bacterium]
MNSTIRPSLAPNQPGQSRRDASPAGIHDDAQPAIEVAGFDAWYGDFQALKNLNMVIPEKRITAFIGPSGCGKST